MNYHQRIMNVPSARAGDSEWVAMYRTGHRDARHAAAEIAAEADAEVERLTADLAAARAERDGLAKALRRSGDLHRENDDHAYRTRRGDGKGHHCQWRVLAEALAERSRAALTEARAALAALRTKGE